MLCVALSVMMLSIDSFGWVAARTSNPKKTCFASPQRFFLEEQVEKEDLVGNWLTQVCLETHTGLIVT